MILLKKKELAAMSIVSIILQVSEKAPRPKRTSPSNEGPLVVLQDVLFETVIFILKIKFINTF